MKIKNNKIDQGVEIICLGLLAGIIVYLLWNWASIPQEVPLHYDWAGNVDRWGSKMELLILPIISWILYLFVTFIEQIPQIWNTGVTVTEENQVHVYRTLKYMIKSTKLIVVVDFTFLNVNTIQGENLPAWFTVAFLLAIFGNLIFWIVRLVKIVI